MKCQLIILDIIINIFYLYSCCSNICAYEYNYVHSCCVSAIRCDLKLDLFNEIVAL